VLRCGVAGFNRRLGFAPVFISAHPTPKICFIIPKYSKKCQAAALPNEKCYPLQKKFRVFMPATSRMGTALFGPDGTE
jgi:hypothetical protein